MPEWNCAQDVVDTLIRAYYTERDPNAVLDCLTEDVQWIGTEKFMLANGKRQLRTLLEDNCKSFPNAFQVTIRDMRCQAHGDSCKLFTFTGEEAALQEKIGARCVRICVCCVKAQDGWRVASVHASVPSAEKEKYTLTKELSGAQEKQQLLLRSIPGGVAIYRVKKSGAVATEYVSEGLAKMCHYTPAEFLAYLREDACINLVPQDRPRVMAAVNKGLERGEEISVSYRIYTKEKQEIEIQLNANIASDLAMGEDDVAVSYAVHAKLSTEAQSIRQEQQRYRAILDYLDVAYFEWMPDKGFYASETYKRYAMSQVDYRLILQNSGPSETVHPDDLPLLQNFFALVSQGVPQASVTLRCKMTDGSYRWTEMMGFFHYDAFGRRTKTVAVLRDVSKEWEEQNKRLQAALTDAQKANRAKTDFLSRISHDMRTPLNGILGLTALLTEKTTDADMLRDLGQMKASGAYLLNLINDTLDVGRIENGKMELHPSICKGKNVLDCILALVEPNAKQKGIALRVHAEGLRLSTLYVDEGRLEQVLVNILGNAIKFTPKGGTIDFTLTSVEAKDGVVTDRFVIEDNGIGMSAEFLPHLFEPFSQENQGAGNLLQGTGLGMAITKSIVEQMGGEILVESELGKGSRFTVLLPMPVATQQAFAAYNHKQATDCEETVLRGAQILLCEDHPLNAEIATRLLAKKDVVVTWAQNGQEAVELFAASPLQYYAAILMDVRMPVMDGLEATKRIRLLDRPDAASVPIIAMTANAYEEDRQKTEQAGMNAHLAKPFEPQVLYQTLRRFLQPGQGNGAIEP